MDRFDRQATDAGPGVDALGDDRPRDQDGELQAHEGHDRQQRVARAVLEDDGDGAEALGAGGAHVIRAQRLDHLGTHDARVGRGADDGEGEGGEYRAVDVLPRGHAIPSDGKPAEAEREEVEEEQSGEKGRRADPDEGRRHHPRVEPRVAPGRGDDADEHADQHLEAHRHAAEEERAGQSRHHDVDDVLLHPHRLTEIALQDAAVSGPVVIGGRALSQTGREPQIGRVLQEGRPVVAVLRVAFRDLLRSGVGAEARGAGIADLAHEHEDDGDHRQHDEARPGGAFEDEGGH